MARNQTPPPKEDKFFSDVDAARLTGGGGWGSLILFLITLYFLGIGLYYFLTN